MSLSLSRLVGVLATAATLVCGVARESSAAFIFLSESAVWNPSTGEVDFTITFNEPPDFLTLDIGGRPKHAFQYYIDWDRNSSHAPEWETLIRGGEIHASGGFLRVRNAAPPDPDPLSGGWGTVRGQVPYNVNGNVITFSVPILLLRDSGVGFDYLLEVSEFGPMTSGSSGSVVPEPGTLALLVGGGTILARRTRARRRAMN